MGHPKQKAEGFAYEALSDEAKAKAREWWQGLACTDDDWWEFVYSDAIAAFACLGFSVEKDDMRFSGFSSPGDGASFGGFFEPTEKSATKAIKEHAPEDQTLHDLAGRVDVLQTTAQLRWSAKGWRCKVYRESSMYSHSNTMELESLELVGGTDAAQEEADGDSSKPYRELRDIARRLADWLYQQLEAEYEYQTSDEAAAEALDGSGYRFDELGHII